MSAERRRMIAIVTALAVFAAAGVFWLTRLMVGGPGAEFVGGDSALPSNSAGPPAPGPETREHDLTAARPPPVARRPDRAGLARRTHRSG